MGDLMLEVNNLTKYYGTNKGIKDLSFKLSSSEILGVVGTNGSGKTTTFRLLLGLLIPDEGKITYNKQSIVGLSTKLFGYLPEDKSVYKDLRVVEQLRFLASLKQMEKQAIDKEVTYWLERLDIAQYKERRIKELSKGNQQKVQLVCALIHKPKIIILDEPLTGLDITNIRIMKDLITELRNEGRSILISSHQYEYIEEFCEKIIILDKQEVRYYGSINEMKLKSELRYVTINEVVKKDYSLEEGVLAQTEQGNVTRLVMINNVKAKKIMRKLLKEDQVISLKLELPTIADIVSNGGLR